MRKNMAPKIKDQLVERIGIDLIGPGAVDEFLEAYPTDVYLTGILFPTRSEIAKEEDEQLGSEGVGVVEAPSGEDEVSLAGSKRPANIGISFVVESDSVPTIAIEFHCAAYSRDAGEIGSDGKGKWKRTAILSNLGGPVVLDFEYKDFDAAVTGVKGLHAHVRTSPWGNKKLVTVAMINAHRTPEEYERDEMERICFFQSAIVVSPVAGTSLGSRPLGGSAVDEDTMMARLIYRDVREYAVGHTCSAGWLDVDGVVGQVHTTWLPSSVVLGMSSEGVKEFSPLAEKSSGPILGTDWLSETSGNELVEGLKHLPKAYLDWLDGQHKRLKKLIAEGEIADPAVIAQAEKHFTKAGDVAARMEGAIKLVKTDSDVEKAFRLANRAIMIQRKWVAQEEDPLIWRPFQLGFILLSLESVANESHEHRKTADLLWFPTGGGKTEAYLALVAFTLFLRRLRYGKDGAGVAAFMRYTLRLLTVQQFQRASALICACDSLRQGMDLPDDLPDDLQTALGNTPFSLGLWVGGDATPNKFIDAKKALLDPLAYNRPDQLKRCPKHRDEILSWVADDTNESVYATCGDPDCLWHKESLPVWTVDTDIYNKLPSLVIGTIDKFAQLARNPDTRRMFGQGVNYRNPDLIIQDELHLISGPLGSLTGLYEVAIDRLCSEGGARPKIIASTATIRQASSQITALFDRETCLFPQPILDASNSGFAVEDTKNPGRCYMGLTTAGRSAKFALQAITASLLQAGASDLFDDDSRDDFWTLVAYFNSLRELGGALVLMQDDVMDSIRNYAAQRGETERTVTEPMELTSRVSSSELKDYLDQLEIRQGADGCTDIVLASNMISVGVDVPRLGVMIVNGQPKGIAEYIQATSRVGRRRGGPGGLVTVIYNNGKARDRSHFETFRTWHEALYRDVEATSVTPFAPRARAKALHAALVILARHLVDKLVTGVTSVNNHDDELDDFIDEIVERARRIDPAEAGNVERELRRFLEDWRNNATVFKSYWSDFTPKNSLLISAEKAAEIRARSGGYHFRAVPTPNSMRNVEAGTLFKLEEELS
jgi:hypothetical protein